MIFYIYDIEIQNIFKWDAASVPNEQPRRTFSDTVTTSMKGGNVHVFM